MNQPQDTQRNGGQVTESTDDADNVDTLPLYRMKRVIIPSAIVLIIAAAGAWYYYTQIRGFDSTDDAFIDGNRVSVSSKILGRIIDLNADEADTVKQGEVLVRLDDADLKAQEAQSRAMLDDARQATSLAEVNVQRATDDYNRAETQYKTRVISQEQFEHARSALAAARSQQKMAMTRVATAEAQVNVVKTSLQNTVITSPMNGVVAKRYALPGDVVQPGQPILSVYDLGSVWVTANFEETKISSLHVGDPVEIDVDAYPNAKWTGRVYQFGASTASQYSLIPPNNASGNFTKVTQRIPVKIMIDRQGPTAGDDPRPLLPGMSVEVRVNTH
ncbi:MAG: HlyD family secretion protein [Bacteroidota bacterium]